MEVFIWGFLGGLLGDALGLFNLRKQGAQGLPEWLRSPLYWIATVGMAIVGGGVALAYSRSGTDLSPILALNIGAATPLIINKLTGNPPELPGPTK